MSRLLALAGNPPLLALEARASLAYSGCVSLDTSTASYTYNLDQSAPSICAATCGDNYQYTAIQAQFCFCFPSQPDIYATFNDSDCSINCDPPYQDESCGGVTPGTLFDVYSFYAGSDISLPGTPSDTSNAGSGASSPTTLVQGPSPSEQPYTPIGPTTTDQPYPVTPAPTDVVTGQASSPTGIAGADGTSVPVVSTSVPGVEVSTVSVRRPNITCTEKTATQDPSAVSYSSGSGLGDPPTTASSPTTVAPQAVSDITITASGPTTVAPQAVSTITITLWTTVTSYTTVYPGGPLQTTVLSSPVGITCVTAGLLTSSGGAVTVTSTSHDGSVVTSVLSGSVQAVTYDPYVSEMTEVEVEGSTTKTVLAAVVPVETAAAGKVRRIVGSEPSGGMPGGNASATAALYNGQYPTAVPAPSGLLTGTGWVVTASGIQVVNATATASQSPVTAGASRAGVGWRDSIMVSVLAVVLGTLRW